MGIPSPYGNQQPEKMCVVCGRPTTNDLVCNQCQSKRVPEPGVARGSSYPIAENYEKREMSANMGWIVACVLCFLLAISFWYIFLQNRSANDHRIVASAQTNFSTDKQEFKAPQNPNLQGGQATGSNPVSPSGSTIQQSTDNRTGDGRGYQSANYGAPKGTASQAQSDNLGQYLDSMGVSGPDVFIDTFRQEFEKDLKNKKVQTWETYWDEVKKFYSGGSVHSGWQDTGNGALSHLKGTQRQTIRNKWDNLGVAIGSDVAKYEYGRKIRPGDLSSLFSDLDDAIGQDKGDGNLISAKLDEVAKKVTDLKS